MAIEGAQNAYVYFLPLERGGGKHEILYLPYLGVGGELLDKQGFVEIEICCSIYEIKGKFLISSSSKPQVLDRDFLGPFLGQKCDLPLHGVSVCKNSSDLSGTINNILNNVWLAQKCVFQSFSWRVCMTGN